MRIVLDLQGAQSESRFRGIGRYSVALAEEIARQATEHDIWLVLSSRFPDSIDPIRQTFADLIPSDHIRVMELPGPVAEADLANAWRMQAAELLREKFIADLRPDLAHLSTMLEGWGNEVVVSAGRFDPAIPTAATLYDLIPLLRSETYLCSPTAKRSYLRHAQSLKRTDLLLAISESSRREAIDALQISADRITAIGAGVHHQWFQPGNPSPEAKAQLTARYGLNRPFAMYTSAIEPRKNVERLIAAFALLPEEIRSAHQLAIVGKVHEGDYHRLVALRREHGLQENELLFLDHVTDEDLRLLYSICSVFVFPSLHEGFGLPVLEAMACGAPVIGSNCSSIPEIIDRQDALFDPLQPADIARCLATVLSNAELRQNLKAWGSERAKLFTWQACARKALTAFESFHARKKAPSTISIPFHIQNKPLLAFISPLPPNQSSAASYGSKLLPNLARHYEIVCVVDQPEVGDPWITSEFPVRNAGWFEENAARFERILYQAGNEPADLFIFDLLERHPGIVLLNDFSVGRALSPSRSFIRALYDSHGWSAVIRNRTDGREVSIAKLPCNAALFRESLGVLVRSNHMLELARAWHGPQTSAFIRRIPSLHLAHQSVERFSARQRQNAPDDAFVVCSFGSITPAGMIDRLLEGWLASDLGQDDRCFLIFVGENEASDYGQRLSDRIAGSGFARRIRITGPCEESIYLDYLAVADVAVQLGNQPDAAGSIIDCLSYRIPLIVNGEPRDEKLPDNAAIKLKPSFSHEALAIALARLRANTNLREDLRARCASHLSEEFNWEKVAGMYRDTIEEVYARNPRVQEKMLIELIGRTPAPVAPTPGDLAAVATALAANRPRFGENQILIDVTILAQRDYRTGIQRVTRAILNALITDPPPGYRVEPVRVKDQGYVYARHFTSRFLDLSENDLTDGPVDIGREDIFLGVDWCAEFVPSLKPWFVAQRNRGTRIIFIAYDVLPLVRPELFPDIVPPLAVGWIKAVAEIADGLVCISRTVADEVHEWLTKSEPQPARTRPLLLGFFHLGADLHASLPSKGLSHDAEEILAELGNRPSFLMVGTLEPRKGHRQALGAFEQLWTEGADVKLVIAGQYGWKADDLAKRIQQHPERGKRLFWLQGISDEMLEEVYKRSDVLLAASEGEGFGLPLIEAAQHGLPVIARDIPVFREVAGDCAYYFQGHEPRELAVALREWLSLGDAAPASSAIPWLTWHQSSRRLLDVVFGKRWYRSWPDTVIEPQSAIKPVGEQNKNLDYADFNDARRA